MTEQEAIKALKDCVDLPYGNDIKGETAEVAISALEEIQQYRELDDKLQMETGITVKELYEKWNVMLAEYLEYQQLGTVEDIKKIIAFLSLDGETGLIDDANLLNQYRLLGTPEELKLKIEELKRWHTNHTVEGIKNEFANTSTLICHNCDHKDEYIMELEAEVEELRKAREKQTPRKPVEDRCAEHTHYKCKCGHIFCTKYSDGCRMGNTPDYCEKCGQAIDWSR